jgi:hypothetical protein
LAKGSFDKYEIESTAKISTRSLMLDFGIGYPGAASPPAAVSYASGQIALAVTGKDRQMWIRRFVEFSSGTIGFDPGGDFPSGLEDSFQPLGGVTVQGMLLGSGPAINSPEPNVVSVFARSPQGHLCRRWLKNGVWNPHWVNLGGILATDPGAGAHSAPAVALMGGARESSAPISIAASATADVSSPSIYRFSAPDINVIQSINVGLWQKYPQPLLPCYQVEGGGW